MTKSEFLLKFLELDPLECDLKVDFTRATGELVTYSYPSLLSVQNLIQPILKEAKVAFTTYTDYDPETMENFMVIEFIAPDWDFKSIVLLPKTMGSKQQAAIISYFTRVLLIRMLNLKLNNQDEDKLIPEGGLDSDRKVALTGDWKDIIKSVADGTLSVNEVIAKYPISRTELQQLTALANGAKE